MGLDSLKDDTYFHISKNVIAEKKLAKFWDIGNVIAVIFDRESPLPCTVVCTNA